MMSIFLVFTHILSKLSYQILHYIISLLYHVIIILNYFVCCVIVVFIAIVLVLVLFVSPCIVYSIILIVYSHCCSYHLSSSYYNISYHITPSYRIISYHISQYSTWSRSHSYAFPASLLFAFFCSFAINHIIITITI